MMSFQAGALEVEETDAQNPAIAALRKANLEKTKAHVM